MIFSKLSRPLNQYQISVRIINQLIWKRFYKTEKSNIEQYSGSLKKIPIYYSYIHIHNINNNLLLSRKQTFNGILHTIKRDFKPQNSFVPPKEKFITVVLEKFLLSFVILFFLSAFIDVKFIWNNWVPSHVHEKIDKILTTIRKYLKKADALAAQEQNFDINNGNHQKSTESSFLNNLIAVFNFNPDSRKNSFRNRRIIEYENRIRLYSNPDKIFRYFATVKIIYNNKESEIYMTPDDFLRALTPGLKQPDGYGLDQYKVINLTKPTNGDNSYEMIPMLYQQLSSSKQDYKIIGLKTDSIFYKLSENGLINFPDFLFLLTVISVSPRNFEIAFRMFDLNGDGEVEYEEFAKVQNAILAQTSVGKKMGKAVRYKGISSAVSKYFFGKDLKQRLTIDHFIEFQETLQKELLTLEFERKNPKSSNGKIHEVDFAELLVAYALFPEKKIERMNKRLMNKFYDFEGISLEDYLHFFRFLQNINDVDIALAIFHIAGASIDQATLKHVAKTVAHVELSDHLVDVVFTIFDDDEDGKLSHKEFIAIMKERLRRGLSKPKDTGFFSIMFTIWKSLSSFDF